MSEPRILPTERPGVLDRQRVFHASVVNVKDFGAVGDGNADDTQAFLLAIKALEAQGGGEIRVPVGTFKVNSDFAPNKPVKLTGEGRFSTIYFGTGAGIRFRFSGSNPSVVNARGSTVENLHILCTETFIPDWVQNHSYTVGTRVRSKLAAIDSPNDLDAGVHFICTQAGTSGSSDPSWTRNPVAPISDGTVLWQVEDWSGISISAPSCHVKNVIIDNVTDCGVFIFGYSNDGLAESIADGSSVSHCEITVGNGHGILLDGDDGSTCFVANNRVESFDRGYGCWDSSFFSSLFLVNEVVSCRRPYGRDSSAASSVFIACYAENCTGGTIIVSPSIFLGGTGPSGRPPAGSTGTYILGGTWYNGLSVVGKTSPKVTEYIGTADGLHEWLVDGNTFSIVDDLTVSDSDDPSGYMQDIWSANTTEVAREKTMERSVWGPNRWRFPRGYFLGRNESGKHQIWICSHTAPPTSADRTLVRNLLWEVGDRVINTAGGAAQPDGWRAARRGGWGGGRFHSGRTWSAGGHGLCIGEGIEPSSANGFVYKLTDIQVKTGSTWATDSSPTGLYVDFSNSEPTWPTTPGDTVTEDIDSTHRIIWTCWGAVGMDWDVLFTPTVQVST